RRPGAGPASPPRHANRRNAVVEAARAGSRQRAQIGDVLGDRDRAAVEVAIAIERGEPSRQDAHRRNAVVPGPRRFVLGLAARALDLVEIGDVGGDLLRAAAEAGVHENDDALVDRRGTERIAGVARGQEERYGREGQRSNGGSHDASVQDQASPDQDTPVAGCPREPERVRRAACGVAAPSPPATRTTWPPRRGWRIQAGSWWRCRS